MRRLLFLLVLFIPSVVLAQPSGEIDPHGIWKDNSHKPTARIDFPFNIRTDSITSMTNDTVDFPGGTWIPESESYFISGTDFTSARGSISATDQIIYFAGQEYSDGSGMEIRITGGTSEVNFNGGKVRLFGGATGGGAGSDGYVVIGDSLSSPPDALDHNSFWVQNILEVSGRSIVRGSTGNLAFNVRGESGGSSDVAHFDNNSGSSLVTISATGQVVGVDGLTITSSTVGRTISFTSGTGDGVTAGGDITITAGSNSDDVIAGGKIRLQAGGNINQGRDIELYPGTSATTGNVVVGVGQLQILGTSNQIKLGTGTNAHTTLTATASASDKTVTFSNNTGTVSLLEATETASGAKTYNGAATFKGAITITDVNVALSTVTGTKWGTGTNQKQSWFGVTAIVQPGATTDLGTVLSNLGLRASGTAYPITTSGAVNFTGGVTINTAALTTNQDLTISKTTPALILTDAAGDDWKIDVTSGVFAVKNTTDTKTVLSASAGDDVTIDSVTTTTVNVNGTAVIAHPSGFMAESKAAGNEATGSGSAALGANSPAVTNTAPYTWLKFKTSDGSTAYVPAWK